MTIFYRVLACVFLAFGLASASGCAAAPAFDDSVCRPFASAGSCPTSYDTPNDTFPYIRGINAIEALTFEQRLDYLGSIHKALMAPEAYKTHRARLLRDAEVPTVLAMSNKDGAFVALVTIGLTFDHPHRGEPFLDAAMAMSDPALALAIRSRVPAIHGYDALTMDYGSPNDYVVVNLYKRLYANIIRAAEKGDPRSCELVAPVDLQAQSPNFLMREIRSQANVQLATLNANCASAPIPSQAIYKHRANQNSIWKSAHYDEARRDSHKQAWTNKALALESKCSQLGIDPNKISYSRFSIQQVARDMQNSWDGSFQDGMDEEQYREKVAEHRYLERESDLYSNGAVITPLLTPYLYIAAVGHSCG